MRFQKFMHRFFCGAVLCAVLAAPLSVSAAQDPLEQEALAAYEKTIESNSWDNWPAGPSVYAESAIVMEADTGLILYAKDMEQKNYPASITKILTALIALEQCDLNEEIEFSYYATHSIEYGSSSIARTEGEILTVEETLYGLLLSSANECANALAEHIAGSNEEFAVLMNEKAQELGCINSHFANPSGLHHEDHYTCAYDMALISQAAINNEDFRRISGTDYYTLRATNKNDETLFLQNHHNMIAPYRTSRFLDDTVFAGKTGYTSDALNTLVTCADRNGMEVIVVTMRTRSTAEKGVPLFTDTAALLDYANNFQKLNISENETTFMVGNAYDFSIDSEDLSGSGSLIAIDPGSTIILPANASFPDAVPSITFEESSDSNRAFLTYEYAGQIVGKAPITLEETQEKNFDFFETESEDSSKSKGKPRFITINLKIVFLVFAVLLAISGISYGIYRFYLKNRAKIRKNVAIYKKRQFLKRTRYRRRKRRR